MKTMSRAESNYEQRPPEGRTSGRFGWLLPSSLVMASATVSLISLISLVYPGQCFEKPDFGASSKSASIKLSDFARPESGVKLLNGIFGRLSQPQLAKNNERAADNKIAMRQLAMANSAQQAQISQFSGGLNASAESTDPALAIRPQAARKIAVGRTIIDRAIPIEGITIAMEPPKSAPSSPQAAQFAGAPSLQAKGELADDRKKSDGAYMRPGQTSNLIIAQNSPYVRDFSQATPTITNFRGGKQLQEESGAVQKDEATDTANGIIRPTEQPGLFKYVREHRRELPKDIPAYGRDVLKSADLRERKDDADQAKFAETEKMAADKLTGAGKAKTRASHVLDSEHDIALESKEGAAVQIAFLPPNTVHGLNGLPLGAGEEEVSRFLKNKGNLNKATVSGWKIWTLTDSRLNPQIQVYLRGGKAEAFRIYSQAYVPSGLGLSLSDELSQMKSKFGEPAFILEEPGVRSVMAKNYVYPVSQVSFQLVRTGSGSAPQILSLLLFRYL